MSTMIGPKVDSATKKQELRLGTLSTVTSYTKGTQIWMYDQAKTNISKAGAVVVLSNGARALTGASAQNKTFAPVGVAGAKMSADEYGWFQIYGSSKLDVSAAVAAGAALTTSATSGAVGALTAAPAGGSASKLNNVFLAKAVTAAGVSEDAFLSYPTVGAAL